MEVHLVGIALKDLPHNLYSKTAANLKKEQQKHQHELDCFLLSSRVGVSLHHAAIPRFQCSGGAKNIEDNKVNHLTITVALCCESHPRQSFVHDGKGRGRSDENSRGESAAAGEGIECIGSSWR